MTRKRIQAVAPLLRRLVLTGIVATGLLLVGCGQTENDTRSATAGLPDLKQSLMAHEWILDAGDSSLTATTDSPVTLAFPSGDSATGTAPCNSYNAAVTLEGDEGVAFAQIGATFRACGDDVMKAETEYLEALGRVGTADTSDPDRLVLTGDGTRLAYAAK